MTVEPLSEKDFQTGEADDFFYPKETTVCDIERLKELFAELKRRTTFEEADPNGCEISSWSDVEELFGPLVRK
jgi:hypothetical protein